MELRKFAACTACLMTVLAAAGCADGTGEALTPTLPTVQTNATNADGTKLKASAPLPRSPINAARVTSLTPTLRLANAAGTFDPNVQLSYVFEISDGTTTIVESEPIPAGATETMYVVPDNLLKINTTYAWRATARYAGTSGSPSNGASFRTPLPPKPVDQPGPIACSGTGGREIIQCVAAAYPERLVKTSNGDFSDERRFENMEFLRDVIIATGKCKGINLGRNYKRGTAVISRDFIVLRGQGGKDGRDRGVDIASGYDDTKTNLKLTWQVFDSDKNWGHPFYADFGPVDCSQVN
jgi:hypothetical protein